MNKVVIGVVVVIGIAAVGAGVYLMQNINPLVKGLIEDIGSDVTKTQVRVAAVDISLTDGSGMINGLTIANPEGFSDDNVFSLDNIIVQLDTGSLTGDVIVIKSIGVEGARVLAEHVGGGTNVQALRNGMTQTAGNETAAADQSTSQNRFALERMTFTNGSIALKSDVFGESTVPLPDFEVLELGTAEQGLTPEELGQEIATNLVGQVSSAVVDVVRELARDAALDKIKEEAAEGLNKLKDLFGGGDKE